MIADELFARHYERVGRWCFRLMGEREAAADLAQDVFLKAHRHLDTFRGTSRFSTWLYTIVRNEGLNRLKRVPPNAQDDQILASLPATTAGPEEQAARASRSRNVMAFLESTLDPMERRVFTLHFGDEMSLDAITRLLGLENESGAKAYVVSAKRKIARASDRMRARGEEL